MPAAAGVAGITTSAAEQRPTVVGRHLYSGDRKLYLRGVTYGPFAPHGADGEAYDPVQAERDFAAMAEHGVNSVRLYTVPPRWLLDVAHRHGLSVLVGLPWEQHVTFLDDRRQSRSIERRVRDGVRACAGHPAVLGYAIGNEIPSSIVRWHGRGRVTRQLERLYHVAKEEDPEGLVTYVNFPTTEYLKLPFVDFVCFNVYLEDRERLSAYLTRLQNLAGDLPVVMAEIGLDSRRNGEERQAEVLDWQVRTAFAAGCAGAFVFAWTDEWHRGGYEIEDWAFGLTTRERQPKPALAAVADAFAEVPLAPVAGGPSVSVVVCSYNGAGTLRDCLEGLAEQTYRDYEVIVVNDGSTDDTSRIASEYDVRLIESENRGLSRARNTGLAAASGDIVAYIDADARPDDEWLSFLAARFAAGHDGAVGGPNLPWPAAGQVARAVANAPGGPTHVLISDDEAEHIPGCNMAFRRDVLDAIGGFDPQFRTAGDDVDVCWRLRDAGVRIGFEPAAVVWHHRRDTVRGYLAQQRGYGEAEGMLERKWPQNYSPAGHPMWRGRLYGNGSAEHHGQRRWRVYYGTWGSNLFQSIYQPAGRVLSALPLMPEYYLLIAALLGLSAAGVLWTPLLAAVPLLGLAVGALLLDAVLGARRAAEVRRGPSPFARLRMSGLVASLYILQPLARLYGRMRLGLTPFRRRGPGGLLAPRPRTVATWSEQWTPAETRLADIEDQLRRSGAIVRRGNEYARWDLEVVSGPLGGARMRTAVEEHGAGRQLLRYRFWPRPPVMGLALALVLAVLAVAAGLDGAWAACALLGVGALAVLLRIVQECASGGASLMAALRNTPTAGELA
jgi:glycosyltransferase involved in cell wall biosynthesis